MAETKTPLVGGNYTAENITWLEGLEAVRHRPGMYIGSTDQKGIFVLCREVLDNSTDEAMGGHADTVTVRLLPDNVVSVEDNGRGIPVDIHPKTGRSALELVMTELHAGGKFDADNYKVAAGLHGVGVSVVNALSDFTEVVVDRSGKKWKQRYEKGVPIGEVEAIGKAEGTGTMVTYKADASIFPSIDLDVETVVKRLRELSYLVPTCQFILENHRVEPATAEVFQNKGGLASYCRHLNQKKAVVHEKPIRFEGKREDETGKKSIEVEVALQYNEGYHDVIVAFGNSIHNIHGGLHESGFKTGLTRAINAYARKKNIIKEKDKNLEGNDVREGLTAVVSIKVSDPIFNGQAKERLNGPSFIDGAVNSLVGEGLTEYFEENPRIAEKIVQKCITAAQAREAAAKASDLVKRKSALESDSLPGKLADCSEKDPRKCEIFLVEGDSAGGCFAGDTLVALADGRNLSFRDLVAEQADGIEHFCYTIRRDGKIGLERALHARVTKRDASVVAVTLDNGERIVCTPDHKFMLRDGSYREAAQLKADDSLMPLYRNGELVYEPRSGSWIDESELRSTDDIFSATIEMNDPAQQNVVFNHRVVSVETLTEILDVYDLEVPGTHNFALASGVFVHNSAKQGRDRSFQAILPLRGKIINVEKNRLDKILGNEEVRAMITAFGTGIADRVDYDDIADQLEDEQLSFDEDGNALEVIDSDDDNGDGEANGEPTLDLDGAADLNADGSNAANGNGSVDTAVKMRRARGGKVNSAFDMSRLRYDRIIIMCDADVDGSHIRTLLLTFLFRYMRPLVETGHIYIAKPPLYSIRRGKKLEYAYTDAERDRMVKGTRADVGRYKGLGEMNPEELWETTMLPANRLLIQVTMEDAAAADQMFSILMGDAVEPRKEFIEANAKLVEDLDV